MPRGLLMAVRFKFTRCETLPRLSWCAHLTRGSGVAHIYHGPWIETRDNWFVEGAWTGDFEKGELDTALFLAGSGGVIRDGRAVFCTPSDLVERLYSIRAGRDLFLSNSMVFLLAMAGDEPDPRHPFYGQTMLWYLSLGLRRRDKTFPTRRGQRVQMHEYCQVSVADDLRIVHVEKPALPRPSSFHEYLSTLRGVVGGVLENAASSSRRHHRYEGLAMVSSGYDSNAVATLMSGVGVREALTIYDGTPGIDSGEAIANHFGMTVHAAGRGDFRTAGVDEAEFVASWPGKTFDIVLGVFEPFLAGRILGSGRHGDVVFGQDPSLRLSDLRAPMSGAGSRMVEFRVRVGFLYFSPFYIAALHLPAMGAISLSDEMAPWRMGGDYDRPIPRRILEEAGVPRGAFATTKRKSAYHRFPSTADLSRTGQGDFEAHRRSMAPPGVIPHGLVALRSARDKSARAMKRVWWTAGKAFESMTESLSRFQPWDDLDFTLHWGHARVRPRYADAVAARDAHGTDVSAAR